VRHDVKASVSRFGTAMRCIVPAQIRKTTATVAETAQRATQKMAGKPLTRFDAPMYCQRLIKHYFGVAENILRLNSMLPCFN